MDGLESLRVALQQALPQLELREREPMKQHTTFRVGGPVTLMALPRREEELQTILQIAAAEGISPFFLGKGSNLLVADEGADVFILKLAGGLTGLKLKEETILLAGSGVTMAQAASFAADHGLSGLEFAHGIPGTLGGGVYMNAGAYGGEMSQVLLWVDCLNERGERRRLTREELELRYRHSVFTRLHWLITGVALQLTPGDPAAIRTAMAELAQRRRAKQPLEFPSAGSTFKRPVGHFAGGLIEQCGLKGTQVGGAQVSEKHAGFIVNTGSAVCQDILQLIQQVQETVYRQTGVLLEPEVRLLGCTLETTVNKGENSMCDHFFMLMYATSGNERNETKFQSFHDVKDAVAVVQDWLERYCCMDCIPVEQEEAVRAANDGNLPETAFLCPQVTEPKDLQQYNGFYDYESLGKFNVFLTPAYDKESAQKFRDEMVQEFGIDQEFSSRADRMLNHLQTFVNSFDDPTIDYSQAEEAIRTFLLRGGFDLFSMDEDDDDIGLSDTVVIPGGSSGQFSR